jgi:hypothetical protein
VVIACSARSEARVDGDPGTTFRGLGYFVNQELTVPSEIEMAVEAVRRAALVEAVRALVQRAVVDAGSLSGETTWGAERRGATYPGISQIDRIDVRFTASGAGLAALRTACRRLDHLVAESLRSGDLSDAAFANVSVRVYDDDGRSVQVAVHVGR